MPSSKSISSCYNEVNSYVSSKMQKWFGKSNPTQSTAYKDDQPKSFRPLSYLRPVKDYGSNLWNTVTGHRQLSESSQVELKKWYDDHLDKNITSGLAAWKAHDSAKKQLAEATEAQRQAQSILNSSIANGDKTEVQEENHINLLAAQESNLTAQLEVISASRAERNANIRRKKIHRHYWELSENNKNILGPDDLELEEQDNEYREYLDSVEDIVTRLNIGAKPKFSIKSAFESMTNRFASSAISRHLTSGFSGRFTGPPRSGPFSCSSKPWTGTSRASNRKPLSSNVFNSTTMSSSNDSRDYNDPSTADNSVFARSGGTSRLNQYSTSGGSNNEAESFGSGMLDTACAQLRVVN